MGDITNIRHDGTHTLSAEMKADANLKRDEMHAWRNAVVDHKIQRPSKQSSGPQMEGPATGPEKRKLPSFLKLRSISGLPRSPDAGAADSAPVDAKGGEADRAPLPEEPRAKRPRKDSEAWSGSEDDIQMPRPSPQASPLGLAGYDSDSGSNA